MANLHKFLSSQGFDIIAFPCNQFGFSERGNSDTVIKDIKKFDISFTFMSKVCANGRDTSPVYRFLKAQPNCGGNITWNYRTKFLISRDASVVTRFDGVPSIDLEPEISRLLAAPDNNVDEKEGDVQDPSQSC
mmetsp:Transcript_72206/g.193094  ORF Transcript_72206/g.193094 Transcript_72206/m.193094 type:complete len:133 (-) Transcript_72206:51-449(-)